MRINTNVSALNGWRHLSSADHAMQRSLERMSSGLRINRASDDAAGLSISENLRSQVRGQARAMKNVQDGLSLLGVADGGLAGIHTMLQRGRELAVQAANGVYDAAQRAGMQQEVDALIAEIDRTADSTTFNGIAVLQSTSFASSDQQLVIDALKQSLLKDGYDTALAAYGLSHSPVPNLKIVLDDSMGGYAAYVLASTPLFNPAILELHINMSYFVPMLKAGNIDLLEYTMAHEMVHAIMADEVNMFGLPSWFKEGAAEFAVGSDDQLKGVLLGMGGDTPANRQALINRLSNTSWGGQMADYQAAALATRYLHSRLGAAGVPGGLRGAMSAILDDQPNDFDDLLAPLGLDREAFLAEFKANGVAWMAANVNLNNADLGGIGGLDADGGAVRDYVSRVITSGSAGDPTPWNEIWPDSSESGPLLIQNGANEGQTHTIALGSATAVALGVAEADLVGAAGLAIELFDAAIARVSELRSRYGADANRLEATLRNLANGRENQAAAESRIRDQDMAAGLAEMTRQQVLVQSASAMLAQAQVMPGMVLELVAR